MYVTSRHVFFVVLPMMQCATKRGQFFPEHMLPLYMYFCGSRHKVLDKRHCTSKRPNYLDHMLHLCMCSTWIYPQCTRQKALYNIKRPIFCSICYIWICSLSGSIHRVQDKMHSTSKRGQSFWNICYI